MYFLFLRLHPPPSLLPSSPETKGVPPGVRELCSRVSLTGWVVGEGNWGGSVRIGFVHWGLGAREPGNGRWVETSRIHRPLGDPLDPLSSKKLESKIGTCVRRRVYEGTGPPKRVGDRRRGLVSRGSRRVDCRPHPTVPSSDTL